MRNASPHVINCVIMGNSAESWGGDPIYNLTFQFVGGIAPPPAPGEKECGPDPTADELSCESSPACSGSK